MTNLPKGWVNVQLGEITGQPEQRVPAPAERFNYIDIASIDRQKKSISQAALISGADAPGRARKVVKSGDTLVSMTRPNLNAVAMVSAEYDGQIASTGFDVLRPLFVEPRWIYYLVRSTAFVQAMSAAVQGALYPAVKAKDVRELSVALAPLKEQARIVRKLDVLTKKVGTCQTRLERVPAILRRFRAAVLEAAVSGKLTEGWRNENHKGLVLSHEIGAAPAAGGAFPVPADWSWATLGSITTNHDNRRVPVRASDRATRRGEFPYYGAFGIIDTINDFLYDGEYLLVAEDGKNLESRDRPISLSAKGRFWVNNHAHVLKVKQGISESYLRNYLNSPALDLQSYLTGIDQVKLTRGALDRIPVPMPPLAEALEISRRVDELFSIAEKLERRWHGAFELATRLGPSLLAKAFRGELVPQDTTDEPANMLLERIRQGRQGAGAAQRRKRKQEGQSLTVASVQAGEKKSVRRKTPAVVARSSQRSRARRQRA